MKIILVALLLLCGCGKNMESKTESQYAKYYGTFHTDGVKSKKWVTLTFDDGPTPKALDSILGTLQKENVKATFFVLGIKIKTYPQYAKKYLEYGHVVGNHTYSHKNFYQLRKLKKSVDLERIIENELSESESAITEAGIPKPELMRMPNGFISPEVKMAAMSRNYVIINWTFGCDWQKMTREKLIQKYVSHVSPGAIFLLHEKQSTADALPAIIQGIKAKGYEIVPLQDILELKPQPVSKGQAR
jgi:peptidoglycan/xylan/chitin deacetylase (PgdA/CDA1 family)